MLQALAEKDPERRQVLQIIGCFAGSKAETLCEGDMILAIDKKPITCFLDIENACQKLDHSVGSDGMLNMTIFREVRQRIISCICCSYWNLISRISCCTKQS